MLRIELAMDPRLRRVHGPGRCWKGHVADLGVLSCYRLQSIIHQSSAGDYFGCPLSMTLCSGILINADSET